MVTKPPRLVAVVSLCTMGPGIVARLGKRLCCAGLRLSCPFYRKGNIVFLRMLANETFLPSVTGV